MFNQLQERLSNAVKTLRGQGKISEKNVKDAIRDVRRALLEADVNLMVVRSFIEKVQKEAIGEKVLKSISPSEQFIKIIYDELISFLDNDNNEIAFNNSGLTIITMVGLQGVGKTTTCAKLASFLKNKKQKTPIMIAADIQRPAAIEQLEVLGKNIDIPVYTDKNNENVIDIVKKGIVQAKKSKCDLVIYKMGEKGSITLGWRYEMEHAGSRSLGVKINQNIAAQVWKNKGAETKYRDGIVDGGKIPFSGMPNFCLTIEPDDVKILMKF